MEFYTSSGLLPKFKQDKPVEGFIFYDNTCPECASVLDCVHTRIKGNVVQIKYECLRCGYTCPIGYNVNGQKCTSKYKDNLTPFPLYDKSIYNFIKSFGDDNNE